MTEAAYYRCSECGANCADWNQDGAPDDSRQHEPACSRYRAPGMIEAAAHVEIFAAIVGEHRRELAEVRALCVAYRALLEEAGISAPTDAQGAEALRRYRAAFTAAGENDVEQPRELTAEWWTPVWPFLGAPEGTPVPDVWPTTGSTIIVA